MKVFYIVLFLTTGCLFATSNLSAQGEPAREEANINQVYSEYGLTGKGVVMVIIDRGIDYFHPDFIDENGKTRLLYLYDMINPTGANDPDNPYGIGTIFTEDEINTSLNSDGPPLSTDRYGHGTATAGIAGGNGSASQSGEFHGVAYQARYIIIKATHDYFPPFDDQPGQDGFFDASYLPVALQFAADKLDELKMPSVTLLNMGSIGGPTDGTSNVARAITNFVGKGFPFVCGVGDDGGNYNHAMTSVEKDEMIDLVIEKNELGNLRLDLWYDETDRFEVSITRPDNTVEGPFQAPANADMTDDHFFPDMNYYHRGANKDFFGATSDRREILIDFFGQTGEYKVTIKGTEVADKGWFHATLNPSNFSHDNKFTTYVSYGYSINDYASAVNAIVPTDYVVKNDWVDMGGNPRQMTGQGNPGQLWVGSSIGRTHDERMGVDFAACGEVLYAAYSPNTYYSSHSWLLVQGGENNYGIQNAVSAAAPLTTGVIALMLEYNSNLTPFDVETALKNSARRDMYTDTAANATWGYGKLDAYAAIQEIDASGILSQQKNSSTLTIYPNPSMDFVSISLKENTPERIESVDILNNLGQEVFSPKNIGPTIDIRSLPKGIYYVLVKTESTSGCGKFIKY